MKLQRPNQSPDAEIVGREQRKRKAAFLSILSNSALVTLKMVVGLMASSVSIVSEAVHSATDLMASLIAFFSVRASDTPPDREHPYGHGKIESISGLAEAALIALAAAYIIYEAVLKLRDRHAAPPAVELGLVVMAGSSLVNFFLARHLKRVAKETDSIAIRADAEHLSADVVASLGVFAGLLITRLTGIAWLDPVAALVVALLILHTSLQLTKEAIQPLLDTRLPSHEESLIENLLMHDDRVLGYHKLRTRKSGSQRHADVHVQIDDNCTLIQAHDLTEELEDSIRTVLPDIIINIHIEPYHAEMEHQREAHGLSLAQANPKSNARLSDGDREER